MIYGLRDYESNVIPFPSLNCCVVAYDDRTKRYAVVFLHEDQHRVVFGDATRRYVVNCNMLTEAEALYEDWVCKRLSFWSLKNNWVGEAFDQRDDGKRIEFSGGAGAYA